jgi:probable HAF family extracellular repeat protein
VYADKTMHDLGAIEGLASEANAINDAGMVVRRSWRTDKSRHSAVLFVNGKIFDLNDLVLHSHGWVLEEATGINTKNEIVGTGRINDQPRAFVLVPSQK